MKSSPTGGTRATGSAPAARTRQPRRDTVAHSAARAGNAEDMIRETAYALYEARGHHDGHALEDWLQAEQQVRLSQGARGSA